MTSPDDASLFELSGLYPDEPSAVRYFETKRWPDGVRCADANCKSERVVRLNVKRRYPLWQCQACGHQFSVTSGTIMEGTHIPLRKWLFAYHIMGASKKGVSALQLGRQLTISYKSAWHLCHRIRATMAQNDQLMSGIVETDEAYIGGKRKHVGKGYRGNKMAVQAIVERTPRGSEDVGQVQAIAHNNGSKVDGRSIWPMLRKHTVPSATVLMTDDSRVYDKIGARFQDHHVVNHKHEIYSYRAKDGHLATTNTAEGYFANLKRQLDGTHHHTSQKHLPRYLEEHDYKYNTRDLSDGARTEAAIQNMEGKRLYLFKPAGGGGESLFDYKQEQQGRKTRGPKNKRKVRKQKATTAAAKPKEAPNGP